MYSWELKKFIEERGYYLGGDDLIKATSIKENPQLIRIIYKAFENKYYMQDNENNTYEFTPMSYEEAKIKKLVRKNEVKNERNNGKNR